MTYKGWYAIKPKQPTNDNNRYTKPGRIEHVLFFCNVLCYEAFLFNTNNLDTVAWLKELLFDWLYDFKKLFQFNYSHLFLHSYIVSSN